MRNLANLFWNHCGKMLELQIHKRVPHHNEAPCVYKNLKSICPIVSPPFALKHHYLSGYVSGTFHEKDPPNSP